MIGGNLNPPYAFLVEELMACTLGDAIYNKGAARGLTAAGAGGGTAAAAGGAGAHGGGGGDCSTAGTTGLTLKQALMMARDVALGEHYN